jgi:hypothetical protein
MLFPKSTLKQMSIIFNLLNAPGAATQKDELVFREAVEWLVFSSGIRKQREFIYNHRDMLPDLFRIFAAVFAHRETSLEVRQYALGALYAWSDIVRDPWQKVKDIAQIKASLIAECFPDVHVPESLTFGMIMLHAIKQYCPEIVPK